MDTLPFIEKFSSSPSFESRPMYIGPEIIVKSGQYLLFAVRIRHDKWSSEGNRTNGIRNDFTQRIPSLIIVRPNPYLYFGFRHPHATLLKTPFQ